MNFVAEKNKRDIKSKKNKAIQCHFSNLDFMDYSNNMDYCFAGEFSYRPISSSANNEILEGKQY